MKEFTDSISNVLKNRLTNPIYGTFFASWVVFHWNFLYALFALNSREILLKTGLLKNDYLWFKYFNGADWYFWFSWFVPFLLTYLVIWKFPKWFLISGYRQEQTYGTEKVKIKIREARKIKEEEALLEVENAREIKAIAEQEKAKKTIKDVNPESEWDLDFQEFKKTPIFEMFQSIIISVYEYDGYIHNNRLKVPTDMLVYADTNGLVEITGGNEIRLTSKGKFFVKKFKEAQMRVNN